MKIFNKYTIGTIIAVSFALAGPITALAATAPVLGAVGTFGIVSDTWTNTLNAGLETAVNGGVCYTTPPATAPISINGVTVTPLSQAIVPCSAGVGSAQAAALADINTQACTSIGTNVALDSIIIGANPPGTFPPGCYTSSGTMDVTLSTNVVLDATAPGGVGNVWIFRSGGPLTTGANSQVLLANGASASNVFWAPVGAASIGANSSTSATPTFVGTIFADAGGAFGINLGHFANLLGRALAFGHTVTTDSNTITVPAGAAPATLHVIKFVINSSGGTAISSGFNLHVKSGGVDVLGSPTVGTVSPGTSYSLSAGTYAVSEDANTSYTQIFTGDCDSGGNVTLLPGDNKICTITNTDIAPPPPPSSSSGSFAPVPLINVTKVPSPLALPDGPGSVTYTYAVTNVGPVPMIGVWAQDNACGPVNFISGDTNNNSQLDLNEVWVYSCTAAITQTTTNTVTAHGAANGWDTYDTANATVVVGVPGLPNTGIAPPLIHLVKTPNVFTLSAPGGLVTYNYTVTNLGLVPLNNVSVVDDKCAVVSGHTGDLNGDNLLQSNEIWSYTCQTYLNQTTTNTGTALGYANGLATVDFSPATVAVGVPRLPNTGFPPGEKSNPWSIAILGVITVVFASFIALKKRKV